MTDDRWKALMHDDNLPLHKHEIRQGWHFCCEWDGLLVGPGMDEASVCRCVPGKFLNDPTFDPPQPPPIVIDEKDVDSSGQKIPF